MKISLIVSDIDGTLLPERGDVSDGIKALAELIRDRHLPFTFCSGRPLSMIEPLARQLGVTLPRIAGNGAAAWNGSRFLWNEFLQADAICGIAEYADALGMSVILSDETAERVYRKTPYTLKHTEADGRWTEVCHPQNAAEWKTCKIQKLLVIDPETPGNVDAVIARIEAEYAEPYTLLRYDDRGFELMPAGCTKGEGVRRLSEQLGIPLSEVMVCGDNKNDLDMFRVAGISAAVGNAVPALKEAADYVSGQEMIYGVIEAIRHYDKGE